MLSRNWRGLVLAAILIISVDCKKYNILSLDSASYSALMTAEFVSYMEKKAYFLARREFCIDERPSEKIQMPELFDMIAGSESGAIIASTLVVPSDDSNSGLTSKYFADTSTKFF